VGPSEDDFSVAEVVAQMGRVLLDEDVVDRVFRVVTDVTDRAIRSASAVSITLVENGEAFTPHASEPVARELDEVQYVTTIGPCLEALSVRRNVNAVLDESGARWPAFVAAAIDKGIAGILSVPLIVEEQSLGALNIYSRDPEPFDATEEATASLLARQAATLVANAIAFRAATALNAQLREALESRDVIGQAKGILMERESYTADAAFDVLRRASQRTNRKLRDVANDLVASVEARQPGSREPGAEVAGKL
jgi:GAF domain-containing protein